MNEIILLSAFLAAFRMATPLVFAAMGGYFSERSGVINIALEGFLLMGAFTSGAFTASLHNPWLGLFAGILFSTILAAVYAFMVIELSADQIIAGIAINLFALGIPPVLCKAIYDVSGGTPMLQANEKMPQFFGGSYFVWGMFLMVIIVHLVHSKTKFGQYVRFSGEHSNALLSQGISVRKIRWSSVLLSGAFSGIGGAYLAIDHGSGFTRSMTAGRGFIALAALIIGRWTPIGAFLAAIVFGFIETSQILLQGMQLPNGYMVPVQWIQMIPYIATLIILAGLFGKKLGVSRPPKDLGMPIALIFIIGSSLFLNGCNTSDLKNKILETSKPILIKIAPNLYEQEKIEATDKIDEDYVAPSEDIRKINAEFIKELFMDTLQREPSSNESTSMMTTLDQGAHFEGMYNGIIYSPVYKLKEKGLASVETVRIFSEIMTYLYFENKKENMDTNKNLNTDQELPKTEIPTVNKVENKKYQPTKEEYALKIQEFKQIAIQEEYSFHTLKRIMGEEMLKTLDVMKKYKEKLATWYGKTAIFLNKYNIDFGIQKRNNMDETYHYRWALYVDEDRIKWEMLHRLHVIMNKSNR